MSSPRLLVLAAMALGCAAFPATGSAALTQDSATKPTPVGYGSDGNGAALWTSDGVLSPGETVNVNFPLRDTGDPEPYNDSATGILYPQGTNGVFVGVSPGGAVPFTGANSVVQATSPYALSVSGGLQCGVRVPLRLAVSGPTMPAGSQDYLYGLPTGGQGAFRRTPSKDVGNIIYDSQTKESRVEVSHGNSLTKGIRVHIDQLDHQFSTYWLRITLISPSGKEALLFEKVGTTQGSGETPNKQLHNVTFSPTAVNGQEPIDAADAALQDFSDVVIKPAGSFDVFDGEPATGTWKLRVTDIAAPREDRRLRGRALTGNQMIKLGDWQIDTAGPVCSTAPATGPAGPDAWFGDEPLILDPAGDTLDASASTDPSFGGSIATYLWDLDGDASSGTDGFETSRTTPTATLTGPMAQGKRVIRLKVVDNDGKVSAEVAREAFITKRPVITNFTADPTQVIAGTPVTLTATATDPDLPVGASLTYEWDLNDDGIFTDGNSATVEKTWTESGAHVVRVRVTDNVGAWVIRNEIVNVANTAPTAAFSIVTNPIIAGEEVSIDASASSDVDGTITDYSWDLNGDGEYGDVDGSTPLTKWTFPTPGEHNISLRVFDNTGVEGQIDMLVYATGRPVPVGTASPASPLKGETVQFNAAGSHDIDAGGSITKYEWDLDGNNSFEVSGPTAVTASRSYPNAGTIVAKLRVTDNAGATGLQLIPIVVRTPDTTTGGGTTGGGTTGGGTTGGGTTGGGTTGGSTTGGSTTGPGGEPAPPGLVNVPPGVDPTELTDPFDPAESAPGDAGESATGFIAKISAGSKAKGRKIYKKGMAVALTANDGGTVVLKVMITPKDAKTFGLKIKKPTAIGSGKLVLKSAGKGKFVVKFAKKYQRYVKKAKKTPVSFRAVVTGKTDGSQLVLARKVVLVK